MPLKKDGAIPWLEEEMQQVFKPQCVSQMILVVACPMGCPWQKVAFWSFLLSGHEVNQHWSQDLKSHDY